MDVARQARQQAASLLHKVRYRTIRGCREAWRCTIIWRNLNRLPADRLATRCQFSGVPRPGSTPLRAQPEADMPDQHSIDALAQPAMIIDTVRPAICVANTQGRRLWGLSDDVDLPIALDPAMPALALLQPENGSDGATVDAPLYPTPPSLVFWTAVGAQNLRCRSQSLDEPGTVLIIFETDMYDAQPAVADAGEGLLKKPPPPFANGIDTHAMAHELRTPIGAIIALAEMIETEQFGPIGDPRYREYARDIGDSARLSLSVVASALDQETVNHTGLLNSFAELSVTELIGKSLRTVRQAALAADVTLAREIPDDLPKLIANGPGLMQILLNLLTNAIKFTPANGTVTVTAAPTSDGGLSISVRDTGVGMTGIDANVLIAADNAAENSMAAAPRRGIGFSLVRRLANAMAADFDVASTRGIGTHVTLTFPAAKVIPVMRAMTQP